jgi:hypothetical protein
MWKICWSCSSLALMDVYFSTVSDRLNALMKQLTIIATVFLPLTFITGFLGRTSTGWTPKIHSWPMFLPLEWQRDRGSTRTPILQTPGLALKVDVNAAWT